jgi:ABC-type lipoprotein export system ATPase subunit
MNGDDYSLVRYIKRRILNNKNFLATITGPTGSGKSWSALSIAELLDESFTADRIIFKGRDLMKLINYGDLKPGSVIIWDEAGIDLSNRNWQSVTNKMLNALLQTFRHKNFILLFTVPYNDFIDVSSRKLFHADFETQRINKAEQVVVIKPKLLQYNSNLSKWYRKYLKVKINHKIVKIRKWKVPKPSDEIIKAYEEKKNLYTKALNIDIDSELLKLEGKDKPSQSIELTCPNPECLNVWGYKGMGMIAQCPKCHKNIKIPRQAIAKVVVKPTTELNFVPSDANDVLP